MIACYCSPSNDPTMLPPRCQLGLSHGLHSLANMPNQRPTLDVLSRGWLAKSEEMIFLTDAHIRQAFIAKNAISSTCYKASGITLIFSRASHYTKNGP